MPSALSEFVCIQCNSQFNNIHIARGGDSNRYFVKQNANNRSFVYDSDLARKIILCFVNWLISRKLCNY